MNIPFFCAFDPKTRRPMAVSGCLESALAGLRVDRLAIAHVARFDDMPSFSKPVPMNAEIVWRP